MKHKDELSRVLSNPDNLIVSDSLFARLDFGEDDPIAEIITKMTVGNSEIPGRFRSYKISSDNEPEEEVKISFTCSENQLTELLNIPQASKCVLEILENKIEGCLVALFVSSHQAELVITVTLNRYI